MDKRVKKDLIYLLIGLTIAFSICFTIFDIIIEDGVKDQNMQNASFKEKVIRYIDIDGCLDDGGCWDYIRHRCEKHDQGYCERDELDCLERKGEWIEARKYCKLK